MIYFPSFIAGILLLIATNITFSFSAPFSPVLNYLLAIPDLNANSPEYLFVAIYDFFIKFVLAIFFLLLYKNIHNKLPFNLKTALFMQLPLLLMTLVNLIRYSSFLLPSSVYDVYCLLGNTYDFTTVLLAYWLIVAYKNLKRYRYKI